MIKGGVMNTTAPNKECMYVSVCMCEGVHVCECVCVCVCVCV